MYYIINTLHALQRKKLKGKITKINSSIKIDTVQCTVRVYWLE